MKKSILYKYSPDFIESGMKYIEKSFDKIHVLKINIKEITAKGKK